MRRIHAAAVLAFLAALIAGLCFLRLGGPLNRPASGDGPYYSGLAHSLASGQGYVLQRSPWPEAPHLGRLPLWPLILSFAMRLHPGAGEFAVLRAMTVFCHALACALLVYLTFLVWNDWAAATLAGFMLAGYAPAYAFFGDGFPEPCWLALFVAGLLLIAGDGWRRPLGALMLGLTVLVRSNYVILPFALLPAIWLFRPPGVPSARRGLLLTALFLLPASFWMLRNFSVSGAFPLLSAMEGETFYGGNNAVVSRVSSHWGGWLYPDQIPGEKPKQELARSMSEAELNRYYRSKGLEFLRGHPGAVPGLLLGKLVRGFLPVPFVARTDSYVGSLFRILLVILFFYSLRRGESLSAWYASLLAAVFLVVCVTTLIFYGTFRFTYCLEALLIPPVAAFLAAQLRRSAWAKAYLPGLLRPKNSS